MKNVLPQQNTFRLKMMYDSKHLEDKNKYLFYFLSTTGKPDPLSNCTVSNQTSNVLQLECIEGFDGGLPQTFEVDVYYARTKNLVTNQSSK